ncbi:MAG: HNH endonuclease [Fimbriimonadaceae bacterium]|nr:HNH endonuclease [Fimbriimonadaceae bacterium]
MTVPPLEGATIEEQARAVLAGLLAAIPDGPYPSAVLIDPRTCPNCDAPVESLRSPYCGEGCRETAAFVRHVRAGLAEGSLEDPDRQVALGQILWYLLGGGRPLRLRLVPDRAIARVIAREGGLCQECGEAATTVDHIATGCNRPINLRAVCARCTRTRPFGDPGLVADPCFGRRLGEFAVRVGAPGPLRCCDDAANWDWRQYLQVRKAEGVRPGP